jgi:hypothetical protein
MDTGSATGVASYKVACGAKTKKSARLGQEDDRSNLTAVPLLGGFFPFGKPPLEGGITNTGPKNAFMARQTMV